MKNSFYLKYSNLEQRVDEANKGVLREEMINTLKSPSQLTHAGLYAIGQMDPMVNANAGGDVMSDYQTGDFHIFLIAIDINNTGCNYGTLILTSPRLPKRFWIGNIWEKKFAHWMMIGTN